MAGILSFEQYIGGADQLQLAQMMPSEQRAFVYNFKTDVTDWQFKIDYQTIVVDTLAYDRRTGEPNFANSRVIGSFPYAEITGPLAPVVEDAVAGRVRFTFPEKMYEGPIIPDARRNVPIVVVGITWTTDDVPAVKQTHRWAIIQVYEPETAIGDPTLDPTFTALD